MFGGLKKWFEDRVNNVANVGSKVYDQLNPLDNGRSWQTRTPTDTRSIPDQIGRQTYRTGVNIVKPIAQTVNTGKALFDTGLGMAQIGAQSLLGTDQSYLDTVKGVNLTQQRDLNPHSGLFGVGTVFKNYNEGLNATPRTIAGKSINYGTQIGTMVAPTVPIRGLGVVGSRIANNAIQSGVGSAVGQAVETGKINPKQLAMDTATGTALGEVGPLAGKAGTALSNTISRAAPTPIKIQPRMTLDQKAALQAYIEMKRGNGLDAAPKPAEQAIIARDAHSAAKALNIPFYDGSGNTVQNIDNFFMNKNKFVPDAQPQISLKDKLLAPFKDQVGAVGPDVGKLRDQLDAKAYADTFGVTGGQANKDLAKLPGFIAKETKTRNGVKDTLRVSNGPDGLQRSIQSERTVIPETANAKFGDVSIPNPLPGNIETKSIKDKAVKSDFMDSTNRFLGQKQAAQTNNVATVRQLPKLDGNQSLGLMDAIENGVSTGDFSGAPAQIRQILDSKYAQLKQAGVDIGYLQDYFPHKWANATQDQVNQAFQTLNLRAGIQNPRAIPTISEGIKLGFKPLTSDYRQALNNYLNTADRLIANRQYFDELKNKGLIAEAGSRPAGMQVIDAPGLPQPRPFTDPATGNQIQGNYYAKPDVANKLNRIYGQQDVNGVLQKTGKLASGTQTLFLSGGLPGTPLNSFGMAQWLKQSLSGRPVTATKDFFRSFSEKKTQAFEQENMPYIQKMESAGVPYRGTFDAKSLQSLGEQISQETGLKKLGPIWNTAVEDATFRRFLPAMQLDTFKGVYDKMVKAGKSEVEATQIAADATRNAFGLGTLADQATRSKNMSNAVSTMFFAPRFRESMVNFWKNNAKALGNPTNPAYRENVKFLANATLLFGAMQVANMVLNNGNSTFQNDNPYDKLSLSIPKNDGSSISIPFLSSTATVPRMAINTAIALKNADLKQAGVQAKGALSQITRPVVDLLTNTKYNNNPITYANQSPGEKLSTEAKYVAGQFNHPWLNAAINAGGKSGLETIATATEAPVKFRNQYTPSSTNSSSATDQIKQAFNSKEGKAFMKLTEAQKKEQAATDPNIRALYDEYQAMKGAYSASSKLYPAGLDSNYAKQQLGLDNFDPVKVLQKYDRLTPQGLEKLKNTKKDAEFNYEAAKYLSDKANGTITGIEDIKAQDALAKQYVGKDYDKTTRDLYGLNKAKVYHYITNQKGGDALAKQLLAYDDALVAAGVIEKNKYRDKYGNVSFNPDKGSSGKKGTGISIPNLSSLAGKTIVNSSTYSAPKVSGGLKKPGVTKYARVKIKKA